MLECINMGARNNRFQVGQFATALIVVAITFICAGLVRAQSGRRSTNGSESTTPSVSGPKTVEKTPAKTPKLHLLVGVEDRNPISNMPYYLSDTVLDNCMRRFDEASEVNAAATGRGMTRADAISRAKAQKEAYVVWLQLGSDVTDSGRQSKNGPDELYVRYTIFEPTTGKVKQSGRSHQSIYKTGRGGVSAPTSKNSPLYSEYAVKQAAREAAERVLEAFDITIRDSFLP